MNSKYGLNLDVEMDSDDCEEESSYSGEEYKGSKANKAGATGSIRRD